MNKLMRRDFLRLAGCGAVGATVFPRVGKSAAPVFQALENKAGERPNIILIVADDMNFDSSSVYGGPIKNLTPHLDRFASEGLRFQQAYSTVAVCQPVREIMHTGLYPHRNGAMGFFPIHDNVRTLNEQLHAGGYLISMLGSKHSHYAPFEKFCVDFSRPKNGRQPSELYSCSKEFFALAKAQNKSFFHEVFCSDPHRPFIGAKGAKDLAGGEPPSRWIRPEEVTGVPGFLEDLPDVRKELACYYTSCRRFDDSVGAVLKALDESGLSAKTLVMIYAGDHGMSFPFAKSNDYENSSRGALFLRWPGMIKPGRVDEQHLVATIDFTPTLLEAAGAPPIPNLDGRSFMPALRGKKMPAWDRVFTFYNQSAGRNWLLMRCMRTKERAYIWNAWSDGKMQYKAENMSGVTWPAMVKAAATNPEIKRRVDFYLYRVPEEFYDLTGDPCERKNLIADPARQVEIAAMRTELLALLQRTADPLAEAFAHRDKPEILQNAKEKLIAEYERPAKGKGKKGAGKQGKKKFVQPAGDSTAGDPETN